MPKMAEKPKMAKKSKISKMTEIFKVAKNGLKQVSENARKALNGKNG